MDHNWDFKAWNDYLGLSALILGGLRRGDCTQQPSFRLQEKVTAEVQGCGFCRNNREAAQIYNSHSLKGTDGRILCPILRGYKCPLCGATGDNAHTLRYCPLRSPMGMLDWLLRAPNAITNYVRCLQRPL
uniref:Nanos homolog 1 n=1 Tax=Leptobrachium leishanense TaxID=445787 RepID=A0A8C5MWD4_9ANUR